MPEGDSTVTVNNIFFLVCQSFSSILVISAFVDWLKCNSSIGPVEGCMLSLPLALLLWTSSSCSCRCIRPCVFVLLWYYVTFQRWLERQKSCLLRWKMKIAFPKGNDDNWSVNPKVSDEVVGICFEQSLGNLWMSRNYKRKATIVVQYHNIKIKTVLKC